MVDADKFGRRSLSITVVEFVFRGTADSQSSKSESVRMLSVSSGFKRGSAFSSAPIVTINTIHSVISFKLRCNNQASKSSDNVRFWT
jgi:hypothetical protein